MTISNAQKSALNVVMGCMGFGEAGKEGTRVSDLKDIEAIIDTFAAHGHTELDTARVYCGGTSESQLSKLDLAKKGLKLETKLYPTEDLPEAYRAPMFGNFVASHRPDDIRKYMDESLKAANTDCLEMWYLHVPSRSTPFEVTLEAVNELHKEGKFKRFGISNYMAWEVAQVCEICKVKGYVTPTVYQGVYSAVQRNVEPELFPCLRYYGLSFYAYDVLGGGFFAGRYLTPEDEVENGSRFDSTRPLGQMWRGRYWKDPFFKAVQIIKEVSDKHGLTLSEVALRWMSHHSLLRREHGDSVLVGASSLKYIEQNLVDLEKGPLPEEVVKALDEAWATVKAVATVYYLPM
ncbi:Aldo/keto reductase [Punctularia strigosozonata HHB-11173 SS5]|uniref:Aldo/keto reductase n=1 Tax=Punctularia strigosozonata (strain HHB-11173) TaxID=741275 RepID=R7S1M8_PUNST|nr:Aldo/keto reductase [Punctularia strigosozonata HHB-11173 SS5]EIN03687.1 Aldo/keto reductase [Punctularia strigosozonata HHB-11173 SS5]